VGAAKTGTAYPSQASDFTPGILVGSVLIILIVFSVLCFFSRVCLRPVSCVPNVASISRLYILIAVFCNVYRVLVDKRN
jgi:hypothetical protein